MLKCRNAELPDDEIPKYVPEYVPKYLLPKCTQTFSGKLLISLELLPKENADAQPVGSGRNDPNQNPYLPPPAGRMKFSFNPFRLSMSLLGPKAFYKVGGRVKTNKRMPAL